MVAESIAKQLFVKYSGSGKITLRWFLGKYIVSMTGVWICLRIVSRGVLVSTLVKLRVLLLESDLLHE